MAKEFGFALGTQGHAVHFKLTPDLISSLREAATSGNQPTIKFGGPKEANVLTIGDTSHTFKALPEDSCFLVAAPPAAPAGQEYQEELDADGTESKTGSILATVRHKLLIAQPQKRKKLETTTKPIAATIAPKRGCIQLDGPVPLANQQQQQQQQQQGELPSNKAAAVLPPLPTSIAKPKATANNTNRGLSSHMPGGQAVPGAHSPAVTTSGGHSAGSTVAIGSKLEAAARTGRLRLVLLALLSERRYGSQKGVKAALDKVALVVPSLRVPTEKADLESAIKAVATYQSPGQYAVNPALMWELDTLEEASGPGISLPSGSDASLPSCSPIDGNTRSADYQEGLGAASIARTKAGGGRGGSSGIKAKPAQREGVEAWIEEIAAGQPEPASPITTLDECELRERQLKAKHASYFRIHQLIESNTRLFQDLAEEAEALGNKNQKALLQVKQQVQRLWAQRAYRVKRWGQAYQVLHSELEGLSAQIGAFKATLDGESEEI